MTLGKWIELILQIVGGAIVIGIVLFVSFFIFLQFQKNAVFSEEKFNQQKWFRQIPATDTSCYRGGMAQDIIDTKLNKKLTSDDVVKLLGKPDKDNVIRYEYWLGFCDWIDTNGLVIEFENNYLDHAYIVQH